MSCPVGGPSRKRFPWLPAGRNDFWPGPGKLGSSSRADACIDARGAQLLRLVREGRGNARVQYSAFTRARVDAPRWWRGMSSVRSFDDFTCERADISGGDYNPASPICSATPPTPKATTGVPRSMASKTTSGNGSFRDGSVAMSKRRICGYGFGVGPRNSTPAS